eukprot:CAMPEP_0194029658 /NCGR_PEP_ID=MMETSP0009_2-20130614/3336_1 /TAXON_ID=210454 /ORGANISM="Grammatophora oceanica, Strain CCMP 410" /LENGTH=249 /DNA_ID=CAMNT_0038669393 /DNA_START=200 /DNA_END=949 /DNA_ORIENTATION=-
MECEHSPGGCRLPAHDFESYPTLFQEALWIPTCGECDEGFVGLGCSIPVVECGADGYCPGSEQCLTMEDGSRRCADCTFAHRISRFAVHQCERPYTEYCENSWAAFAVDPHFCTHGGKCTVDGQCNCPPEFEGPNCQYMKLEPVVYPKRNSAGSEEERNQSHALAASILVPIFILSGVAVLFVRNRRRSRHAYLMSGAFHDINMPNMWIPDYGEEDEDAVAAKWDGYGDETVSFDQQGAPSSTGAIVYG